MWDNGKEKTIEKFNGFNDLPTQIHSELKNDAHEITIRGEKYTILEINRDLCQHGKGMHVKVRVVQSNNKT